MIIVAENISVDITGLKDRHLNSILGDADLRQHDKKAIRLTDTKNPDLNRSGFF